MSRGICAAIVLAELPFLRLYGQTGGICGAPYSIEPRNEPRHFCLFVGRGRIAISYKPAAGSSPLTLSLSLSRSRFHPRRTIVLLIFQSCAEKERVARLPRPTAASFFRWPRLVQWLHRSLYRRRDRHGGEYRPSKLLPGSKLKPSCSFTNPRRECALWQGVKVRRQKISFLGRASALTGGH